MAERKAEAAVWSRHGRNRLGVTILFVLVAVGLLAIRLLYLQGYKGSELAALAAGIRRHEEVLPPQRGDIVDRNQLVLAGNKAAASIYAYPNQIKEAEIPAYAKQLAPLLGVPEKAILEQLTSGKMFVWLRRKLEMDKVEKAMALHLKGIYSEEERIRYYPEGNLASQLLGFVNMDHKGIEGLELEYNQQLLGKPGSITAQWTPTGDLIAFGEEKVVPPQPGLTLQLAINAQVQRLAEQQLEKYVKEMGAKRGLIALEDPRTGEILALAMYPSFDPNTYMNLLAKEEERSNWAVLDALSPGSIFKPITASMALEEHVYTGASRIRDPGYLKLPGWTITNFEPGDNGEITLGQALAVSSNVAMGTTAMQVGKDNFYRYLKAFNLDGGTGVDLPGESGSILYEKETATPLDLALMGIGQSMNVTPMQILAAESAIANNGVWVQPHVAKQWLNADGTPGPALKLAPGRQVISRATAEEVRNGMKLVLQEHPGGLHENGTGILAKIEDYGYTVAGKTGTAEKTDPKNGKLMKDKFLNSFIGFVPADNPQVVALVMLDEPTSNQGLSGLNTAPLFRSFMPEALQILGIKPDLPTAVKTRPGDTPAAKLAECKVPRFVGMDGVGATQAAHRAGYRLKITGAGDRITAQASAPDAKLSCLSTLTVTAGGAAPPGTNASLVVRVPDLWQLPLSDVADTVSAAGFMPDIKGTGLATAQDPAPGGFGGKGSILRVTLSQP